MMIHEKLTSGQFLLDFKNDRSGLILPAPINHHQQSLHHLQPPSPIPALDIYSAYAYQQQLQHQLLNPHISTANPVQQTASTEVLDLSRRDTVETSRKTPSPYHTNSSLGSGSPAESPNNSIAQQPQIFPTNLLYAAQAQQQAQNVNNLNIPVNLAALYPGLYYPTAVKQEAMATTPPPSQSVCKATSAGTNALLKPELTLGHYSPEQAPHSTAATTPTSSNSNLASVDPKNTRPFKAFPRDPLVIAANFAAADVLLDNPRVERYTEYRKRVLEQIRSSNGGSRTVTNPKMRRTNSISGSIHGGSSSNNSENDDRHHEESSDCESNSGHDNQSTGHAKSNDNSNSNNSIIKDAAYYERRRKNNAAAKKSRDRRRIKEDEIAIRAAYLERQNIELLCQIDALKAQLAALTAKMA